MEKADTFEIMKIRFNLLKLKQMENVLSRLFVFDAKEDAKKLPNFFR